MSTPLGSVLVIGGCGFLGFHLVRRLLSESSCSSVSVLSRNPNRNRISGATYHAGDINSPETIKSLLEDLKPTVIIHAASPTGHEVENASSLYRETNIQGTTNLLSCAAQIPSVRAFIYTSSSTVIAGSEHKFVDESAPLLTAVSEESNEYAKSKAVADILVLEADDPTGAGNPEGTPFRTACIRPVAMYGERDTQIIPNLLGILRRGEHRFQLGDNSNLFDWAHVENVVSAHILAVKALLTHEPPSGLKVGGEAFLITDGLPLPFWDLPRKIWAVAGDCTPTGKAWVIPTKVALRFAAALEWIHSAVGTKKKPTFSRQAVEYCCLNKTYGIAKARERLGYVPNGEIMDDGVRQGVEWVLKEHPLGLKK